MKRAMFKFGAIACIVALCLGLMAGCSNTASSSIDSAQQENRSYMSQVNGIMDQLGDDLESFVDAVSRGDLVNMRTQAENAYRSLDDLSHLEAPQDLADVQQLYVEGTSKLREALDGYIDLYTAVEAGTLSDEAYATRLSSVQSIYDEGVSLLEKGDATAADK